MDPLDTTYENDTQTYNANMFTEANYVEFNLPADLDLSNLDGVSETLQRCRDTLGAARRILNSGNVKDVEFWENQISKLEDNERTLETALSKVIGEEEIF